jgi:bifunctional non-homologous end joining protein LigD
MTWKFKQIKPQKARGEFLESMWTDLAWSAENKYDGDRRIAQFCGVLVRLTGTRESVDGTGFVEKSHNLPHLQICEGVLNRLDGTVLDGEIVAPFAKDLPGGESKYVTAIMGSLPARAVELQKKHGWLEYMVFDCLWHKGMSLLDEPLAARRDSAVQALAAWGNKYAKIVPSFSNAAIKRRMWEQAKEGLVFKHADHLYGNEKLWVKLKKEATADVVVMGFEPGKGKYKGQVGAIIFGQYQHTLQTPGRRPIYTLERMGTCSGFDDALRRQMTEYPVHYKGRVLRIRHNGREPTGAFRHPRFDSWRDDKSAKDCVYDPEET